MLRYFPTERGQPLVQGPITLVLSSVKAAPTHVERMITLQYRDQSLKRTVIHLQFTSWPELYGKGLRGAGGGMGGAGGSRFVAGTEGAAGAPNRSFPAGGAPGQREREGSLSGGVGG